MSPRNLVRRGRPPTNPIAAAQIRALASQRAVLPWLYHSTVKFFMLRQGAGPYTYTLPANQQVVAFSYAIDGDRTPAGYTAADGVATYADTNLEKPFETTSAEQVRIRGIAIHPLASSWHEGALFQQDGNFLAALCQTTSISVALNANQVFRVGTIPMVPGAGGLNGIGKSTTTPTNLNAEQAPPLGVMTNGWPVAGNYFSIPRELYWNPAGNPDSQLKVRFTSNRAIQFAAAADRVAGAGITAFSPATVVCQEFKVVLVGETVTPRSDFS